MKPKQSDTKVNNSPHRNQLIIYYTPDKLSFQLVKPVAEFKGDWRGLAEHISKGLYSSFEIIPQ